MTTHIFIHVQYGRAMVSRYQHLADGSLSRETALNTTALAADALKAVATYCDGYIVDGDYLCPPEIAVRAEWRSSTLSCSSAA